jgi:hypothetical protein
MKMQVGACKYYWGGLVFFLLFLFLKFHFLAVASLAGVDGSLLSWRTRDMRRSKMTLCFVRVLAFPLFLLNLAHYLVWD